MLNVRSWSLCMSNICKDVLIFKVCFYFILQTSCRRAAATICIRSLQVDNIFVFIGQVAPVPACWLGHQQVDL